MLCGLSSMSYGVTGPLQCSVGLSWLQKINNFFFQPLASEDFSGNYKHWMTGTGQGERRCWPLSRFGLKLSTTREQTECLQLISVLMLAYSSASGDAGLPVLSTLLCGLRWITEITKAVFAHF